MIQNHESFKYKVFANLIYYYLTYFRFFTYFFDLVIIVNAFCVAFNEETSDIAFLVLFNLEIILKLYTFGPKEFISKLWNM